MVHHAEGVLAADDLVPVTDLGLTIPAPRADAELSELPFTMCVPALIPVNSEASGVTRPMISFEGNTSGKSPGEAKEIETPIDAINGVARALIHPCDDQTQDLIHSIAEAHSKSNRNMPW